MSFQRSQRCHLAEVTRSNLQQVDLNCIEKNEQHSDKDSLLDRTLVRLMDLLLGPSVYFFAKPSFGKNAAKSVSPEPPTPIPDHYWYLITLDILSGCPPLPPGDV